MAGHEDPLEWMGIPRDGKTVAISGLFSDLSWTRGVEVRGEQSNSEIRHSVAGGSR